MQHYVGLMSGTSLDGIDAVVVEFDDDAGRICKPAYCPYPDDLKQTLLSLHEPSDNELELSQTVSIRLAQLYAQTVNALRDGTPIHAIGCHGQTIRHRPELGFTLQLNNPALLAELCGVTVIADFRSRDIAAGGQGAPLVPAFHQGVFKHPDIHRTILNIGGISNLTDLPCSQEVAGFDCGPGNLLMDAWCYQHTGKPYDEGGTWAASGKTVPHLLDSMLAHPFFELAPPKSTGRDMFNIAWLESLLTQEDSPQDVQATLLELTAYSIAESVSIHCIGSKELYICGGGAHNQALVTRLKTLLPALRVALTDELGIGADWVEAAAFAWLAKQTLEGKPGNLPAVTGAKGYRILGAIHLAS